MNALFSLLCAAGIAVQAQTPQIYRPDPSPPARVILDAPVTVPLAAGEALPIIEVRVNGQGPFRFGIETGANFIIVTPALAERLQLPRAGGPDHTPSYRIASIEVGAARFEDLPVSAFPFAQSTIDGVLGLPFYRDLLLTIDYSARTARFERGSLPAADGQSILPLTRVGDFWSAPIAFGGVAANAVIDTRSSGGFGVTPSAAASLTFDGGLAVVGRARGAAIAETVVKAGRLKTDVTMGRYTFPAPMVSVRELPPGFPQEPLMGTRVLSHFVMTLDQRNERVRFEKTGSPTIALEMPARPAGPAAASAAAPGTGALAVYAGRFGVRTISVIDGQLFLQRDGGPALRLVPDGRDAFTIADIPQARVRFLRDTGGSVTTLDVLNREGQWESAGKSIARGPLR